MTPEIERLAKEAGAEIEVFDVDEFWSFEPEKLAKFAALIAEECAKVVDSLADGSEVTPSQQFALDLASDAIRAKFALSDK